MVFGGLVVDPDIGAAAVFAVGAQVPVAELVKIYSTTTSGKNYTRSAFFTSIKSE